ncbi:MAG: RHS repeat-associated core domain-containing protein [Pyrinomonadaceae bacterium]
MSASYSYQPFNKLTNTATASYAYNANGNIISKVDASGTTQYVWDYENRLKQVIKPDATSVSYKYDALGRRAERSLSTGAWTRFTHDGPDVIKDTNSDTTTVSYLNGLGIDNKLKQIAAGQTTYFLKDHLGSTRAFTDSTGAVTASTGYDSFGNATNSSFSSRYQFTGREFDSFSGLQYSRARFYDPTLGRFISEDPIDFGGGDINLYGYVRNMPLWFRDPRGLQPGGDVLQNPNTLAEVGKALMALGGAAGALVTAAASSPAVVAGVGLGAGATIGYPIGVATAAHPNNPLVNGRWNPWGTPFPMLPPWTPTTVSGPRCEVRPRPIPWFRDRTDTWPSDPPNDRDGCAEEISACHQRCVNIGHDQDYQGRFGGRGGVYGGSYETCMSGCISENCKKGTGFR